MLFRSETSVILIGKEVLSGSFLLCGLPKCGLSAPITQGGTPVTKFLKWARCLLGSQGEDLQRALARDQSGDWSWHRRGRHVAMNITRGLHFLHASGFIHRRASNGN